MSLRVSDFIPGNHWMTCMAKPADISDPQTARTCSWYQNASLREDNSELLLYSAPGPERPESVVSGWDQVYRHVVCVTGACTRQTFHHCQREAVPHILSVILRFFRCVQRWKRAVHECRGHSSTLHYAIHQSYLYRKHEIIDWHRFIVQQIGFMLLQVLSCMLRVVLAQGTAVLETCQRLVSVIL